MSVRGDVYRRLFRGVSRVAAHLLPRALDLNRRKSDCQALEKVVSARVSKLDCPVIWFHAASVGELESLWEVIGALSRQSVRPVQVLVSVFSRSARDHANRLIAAFPQIVVWVGYSPLEGDWQGWISRLRPQTFVTSKYEAWPELWMSLSESGSRLVILGASDRRSIRLAMEILKSLGEDLPSALLLPFSPGDEHALSALWPDAQRQIVEDPRWERVSERVRKGSVRMNFLAEIHSNFSRPWGVLGSIWPADFVVWQENLKALRGTLWVVPHKIEDEVIESIKKSLDDAGIPWSKTSEIVQSAAEGSRHNKGASRGEAIEGCHALLVDEMGFLAELYAFADWAYVGGGFGSGVHSVIEPGLHGIPIAIGPERHEMFREVGELGRIGQLTLIRSAHDLGAWLKELRALDAERVHKWSDMARLRARSGSEIAAMLLTQTVECKIESPFESLRE